MADVITKGDLADVGETTCLESGDPSSAAPSCCTRSKLGETVGSNVDTLASEAGSFNAMRSPSHLTVLAEGV